jgi:uncharacterized protein (DUF736 family)
MTIIGEFTRTEDGFEGRIVTLSVQSLHVRIRPVPTVGRSGVTHRVLIGEAIIGEGRPPRGVEGSVLSITLDDPSFAGPIIADLVPDDRDVGFDLVWRRAI